MAGSRLPDARTTFEHSPDGAAWTDLGAGLRIPGLPAGQAGGWQLTGLSLPPGGTIRARGHVTGASYNGSGWFVETALTAPWAIRLNLGRAGSDVVLNWTGGQGPYQVQQTTTLGATSSWENVGEPVQANSLRLPLGSGPQFLRVRGQ